MSTPTPTKLSPTDTCSTDVSVTVSNLKWLSKITPQNHHKNDFYAVLWGVGGTNSVGAIRNFEGKESVEFCTFQVSYSHQIKVTSKADGIKEIQKYYGPTINTEDGIRKLLHETAPLGCSNLDNRPIPEKCG